jgi:hypothetical protein
MTGSRRTSIEYGYMILALTFSTLSPIKYAVKLHLKDHTGGLAPKKLPCHPHTFSTDNSIHRLHQSRHSSLLQRYFSWSVCSLSVYIIYYEYLITIQNFCFYLLTITRMIQIQIPLLWLLLRTEMIQTSGLSVPQFLASRLIFFQNFVYVCFYEDQNK